MAVIYRFKPIAHTAMLIILAVIACPVSGQVPAASTKYKATVIKEAHAKGGLNAPVALFAGQLQQESSWNANAHSSVGAEGLAEFMPSTALWISKTFPADLPGAASYDPQWSIRALIFYDFWLHQRVPMYQETDENRWAASLAAYNGGIFWTLKAAKIMQCQTSCLWWNGADSVNDGRTPANLTQNRNYPFRIIRLYEPRYRATGWQ